jgi:hypothetical protein
MAYRKPLTPEQQERTKAYRRAHYLKNKERILAEQREYLKRPEVIARKLAYAKTYYAKNRDLQRARSKQYYLDNREGHNANSRAYYAKNKKAIRATCQRRHNERYATDPAYRISTRLRCSVNRLVSYGWNGSERTRELLGCDWQTARKHLEQQFKPGMTWENHGIHGWHIDHIRPLRSFDLTDPAEAKVAFHYTNLQPMWAEDNIRKGAKWAA